MTAIHLAESDETIARCFPVMQQLRPHLSEQEFVPAVRRQHLGGYRLAYLEEQSRVCAVAGFRLLDMLVHGRVLYITSQKRDRVAGPNTQTTRSLVLREPGTIVCRL